MILETFNGTKRATGMFHSCVRTGSYGLRACAHAVEDVLDVGANVGFFSVTARVLCPDAAVVAVEPDPDTFGQLLQNAKHMRIQPVKVGLGDGDGRPLLVVEKPPSDRGCYGTRYSAAGNGMTAAKSTTVPALVAAFGLNPDRMFLKIDCEGGEHSIKDHAPTESILRRCAGIGGEIHPIPDRDASREFKRWLTDVLSPTHDVKFLREFRQGIGEFRCVRKKLKGAKRRWRGTQKIEFVQDLHQLHRDPVAAGQVAKMHWELAAHMVCCGYAEYLIE